MWEFLNTAKEKARAKASMQGDGVKGSAEFTEYEVGTGWVVKVKVEIQGDPNIFTPGKHAVHIHEKGECECEGFKCAGGHFDPGPAGNTDPDLNHPFHAGDLPNIEVDTPCSSIKLVRSPIKSKTKLGIGAILACTGGVAAYSIT